MESFPDDTGSMRRAVSRAIWVFREERREEELRAEAAVSVPCQVHRREGIMQTLPKLREEGNFRRWS